MATLGKGLYFEMGLTTEDTDLTANHGLRDVTIVVDGTPIERPTQGDLAQFFKAARRSIVINFSVESDADMDPLFYAQAGEERAYGIGKEKGSRKEKHTGKGILDSVTTSLDNDDLNRHTTSLRVNTWTAGTQ